MKLISALLFMQMVALSQAATFSNGDTCDCDSIHITQDSVWLESVRRTIQTEIPFVKGHIGVYGSGHLVHARGGYIELGYYVLDRYYRHGTIAELYYNDSTERATYKVEYLPDGTEISTMWYDSLGNDAYQGEGNSTVLTERNNVLLKQEYFYESGALKGCVTYDNKGQRVKELEFFRNGTVAGTTVYKNGRLSGYKKCSDGRMGSERLTCTDVPGVKHTVRLSNVKEN